MTEGDLKAVCMYCLTVIVKRPFFLFLGYYFVVWLMLMEFSFTTAYLDNQKAEYQVIADDVMFEVTYAWSSTNS